MTTETVLMSVVLLLIAAALLLLFWKYKVDRFVRSRKEVLARIPKLREAIAEQIVSARAADVLELRRIALANLDRDTSFLIGVTEDQRFDWVILLRNMDSWQERLRHIITDMSSDTQRAEERRKGSSAAPPPTVTSEGWKRTDAAA